mgnify:CR=1 FL=1
MKPFLVLTLLCLLVLGQDERLTRQKVMEEIIKGSQEVCSNHPFIDASKVGCLGAGYGGYLTMYLINETAEPK